MSADPFDLARFVSAQDGVFNEALAELRQGRKETHWMWFIFPQLEGLGRSETAQFYGIKSAAEAAAYLRHPVLGARLMACCNAILALNDTTAAQVFGSPDDVKLRSSMTLFAQLPKSPSVFRRVLDRFFGGEPDPRTLELLSKGVSSDRSRC